MVRISARQFGRSAWSLLVMLLASVGAGAAARN